MARLFAKPKIRYTSTPFEVHQARNVGRRLDSRLVRKKKFSYCTYASPLTPDRYTFVPLFCDTNLPSCNKKKKFVTIRTTFRMRAESSRPFGDPRVSIHTFAVPCGIAADASPIILEECV